MKVRRGFVSNSSSSSFIVVGGDPPQELVHKLTDKQKELLLKDWSKDDNSGFSAIERDYRIEKEYIEKADLYITNYISDDDESINLDNYKAILYASGGHGYPYGEEDFEEVEDSIWLRNEHAHEVTGKIVELREQQLLEMCKAYRDLERRIVEESTECEAFNLIDPVGHELCHKLLKELKE